ncbi:biotin transporter BioY [Pseudogemmobacter hezensis]|uniref:biotin transporter BioY n=1 Tax=Pseudogemmobacter hezensis TaxID=2737662 RepID=UPI0020A648C2|nr:biotin transporter BioY [Pseudogemmobacter hezensis]
MILQTYQSTRAARAIPNILVVIMGVALMTLAARTQVPFWPVPMTLHTLAVMGFAVALGPRMAVAIVSAYLAAGAMGVPVFSGSPERGIGLAYMVGPTGGYLLGYLLAAGLTGYLARGRGTLGRFGAMGLGLVVVYAAGAAWLATLLPANQILAVGVLPFVIGDLAKIALVAMGAALIPALITRLRGRI